VAETVDDDLWSAVGDPTRRRLLDLLLAEDGGTATTLGRQLPVTRQAVAKHLVVLDRAGLVRVTPSGRERRYRVDDVQLARAVAQLSSVGSAWDARLRRIKAIAERVERSRQAQRQPGPERRRSRPERRQSGPERRQPGPESRQPGPEDEQHGRQQD
jgi:DNA-binding transcriptional ArsR family regulator